MINLQKIAEKARTSEKKEVIRLIDTFGKDIWKAACEAQREEFKVWLHDHGILANIKSIPQPKYTIPIN